MSPNRPVWGVDAAFDHAVGLHRQGKIAEAMALYQTILEQSPEHSGAVHLLGVALSQQGQYTLAAQFIQSAILLNGAVPIYHVNLGNALMGGGDALQAEQAYGRALALDQSIPEAWFGQGNARMALGLTEKAVAAFEQAASKRVGFAEALANLGRCYLLLGRDAEAVGTLDQAVGLRPDDAAPRFLLAQALDRVGRKDEAGAVYLSLGQVSGATVTMLFEAANWLAIAALHEPAVTLYRAALVKAPGEVALLNNLANSLRELGRLDEARSTYETALTVLPDDPSLVSNLGSLAKDLGDLDKAVQMGLKAVALGGDVLAHSNLGYAYYLQGKIDDAAQWFDRAESLAPGDADAVFHQGIVDLARGNWRRGWNRYEQRWNRRRATEVLRHPERPLWTGGDIEGKRILVWSEQGLGDTVQFIRFADVLANRGATVLAEVQAPLVSALAQMPSLQTVVSKGDPVPEFDLQIPLLSLPHALDITLENLPIFHAYVSAPPDRLAFWRDWWLDQGALGCARESFARVGLVWAGESRKHDVECLLIDQRRSMNLAALSPILQMDGIDFVSLQLGPARRQISAQGPMTAQMLDPMDLVSDFADTAGLIETLDAVISVDTSVLHLAGAMGKPVFALSRFDACWRWLLGRDDSPWYPSLKLYRQFQPGQWAAPVESLKLDMVRWLEAR